MHFKTMISVHPNCAESLPSVMVECPAISRLSLKYNSTDLKSSVQGDHNRPLCFSSSVTSKCTAISRTSLEYNCLKELCLQGDLNNECAESLTQCH